MPHHKRKAHKNSGGTWIVDKILDAKTADQVSWTAPDDSDIVIWFPPKRDPLKIGTKPVTAGQTLGPFTVPPNAKGTYPYSVYLYKDNVMAEGGSGPEIIIVG